MLVGLGSKKSYFLEGNVPGVEKFIFYGACCYSFLPNSESNFLSSFKGLECYC